MQPQYEEDKNGYNSYMLEKITQYNRFINKKVDTTTI